MSAQRSRPRGPSSRLLQLRAYHALYEQIRVAASRHGVADGEIIDVTRIGSSSCCSRLRHRRSQPVQVVGMPEAQGITDSSRKTKSFLNGPRVLSVLHCCAWLGAL